MRTSTLGASGVTISAVGLGGFELGPEEDEVPDVERAARVLSASLDAGINWLDTSENYLNTRNEQLIGPALERVPSDMLVSTKVAPTPAITGGGSGFRPEQVHAACRDSLRRLRRDHVDMYLLHWPDEDGVPLEETWGAMAELAEQGLARAIGMSNYEREDVDRMHAIRPVDLVQDGLSMIDYLEARDAFAAYGEAGIGVTVYEPLASGILGGKTPEQVLATWTGPWVESDFYKRLLSPGKVEKSFAVADGVRPVAERLSATVAQVAIAWVLLQRGVSAAIVGSHDGGHVRENAASADLDVADAMDELESLIPLGPTMA